MESMYDGYAEYNVDIEQGFPIRRPSYDQRGYSSTVISPIDIPKRDSREIEQRLQGEVKKSQPLSITRGDGGARTTAASQQKAPLLPARPVTAQATRQQQQTALPVVATKTTTTSTRTGVCCTSGSSNSTTRDYISSQPPKHPGVLVPTEKPTIRDVWVVFYNTAELPNSSREAIDLVEQQNTNAVRTRGRRVSPPQGTTTTTASCVDRLSFGVGAMALWYSHRMSPKYQHCQMSFDVQGLKYLQTFSVTQKTGTKRVLTEFVDRNWCGVSLKKLRGDQMQQLYAWCVTTENTPFNTYAYWSNFLPFKPEFLSYDAGGAAFFCAEHVVSGLLFVSAPGFSKKDPNALRPYSSTPDMVFDRLIKLGYKITPMKVAVTSI
jgi:hypothetical protein